MIYKAVFYKNPAFKEESEWRLVYYPFGNLRELKIYHKSKDMAADQLFYDKMYESVEYTKDYLSMVRSKINFGITGNKIISYIDMNFEKIKELLIAQIIIDPKSL